MVVGILGAVAQTRHQADAVLHPGQPHRLHGVRHRAGHRWPAWARAIFYVAHHITIQTTLFLVAGLIERRGGTHVLDRLGGLAKLSPVLAVLFFVPAMNLAGIPPFSGFLGKVGLLQAGVELGTPLAYVLVVGGVLTSLLTLLRDRQGLEPGVLAQARGRRTPRSGAPGGAGRLRHGGPGRQDECDPAAPHHGGLHPGPGGLWRGPDGLCRAAVQGGRPVRPGDAGPDPLHPGRARRGRARAAGARRSSRGAAGGSRAAGNEPEKDLPAPGTAAAGVARLCLGRALAELQPGQSPASVPSSPCSWRASSTCPRWNSAAASTCSAPCPFALIFLGKVVAASFQVLYLAVVRGPT